MLSKLGEWSPHFGEWFPHKTIVLVLIRLDQYGNLRSLTPFPPPFLLHAKIKGNQPRSAMDGTCNAVMSAEFYTINDYRIEGLQQLRALPDNSEHWKEGHHVKVRSIEGWADGA